MDKSDSIDDTVSISDMEKWISDTYQRISSTNNGLQRFLPSTRRRIRTINNLKKILAGKSGISSIDILRTLIASGILNWSESIAYNQLKKLSLPSKDIEISSFSAFALWPLVVIEVLPSSWFDDLQPEFRS